MGCQKLKTNRVRSQQKQRELEPRRGCSVVAYKPTETASKRNRSRRSAGRQTLVCNKIPQPDTTTTIPRATTQARAGALMFPSSCLDGSITRVGPGLNPQYTRAWYATEAVGCSLNRSHPMLKRAQLSNMVAEQRMRQIHNPSDLFTRRAKMRQCVSQSFPTRISGRSPCKEVQIQTPTE